MAIALSRASSTPRPIRSAPLLALGAALRGMCGLVWGHYRIDWNLTRAANADGALFQAAYRAAVARILGAFGRLTPAVRVIGGALLGMFVLQQMRLCSA